MLTKRCLVCGKEFTKPKSCGLPEWFGRPDRPLGRRFCSTSCAKKDKPSWNKGLKTGLVPKTAFKKGEFRHPETAFKKGLTPWNKGRNDYITDEMRIKLGDYWRGKNGALSPNWKGGTTQLGRWIRSINMYKQWRTAIFQRDNWTCQHCRARSQKGSKVILHVDHITPFYKILEEHDITTVEQAKHCKELWDITNGRTLCIPCHKQTPSYLVNQYTK